MVPSCFAFAEYFFCNRNQNPIATNPNAITPQLNPAEMGTKTVSKVHSMNFPMGVMISCVFMSGIFAAEMPDSCPQK